MVARGEGTMSSMRDAGVVLVLLLLAATVRVDQPSGASIVPAAEAALPAVESAALPASQPTVIERVAPGHEVRRLRIVRLSGTVALPGAKEIATVVLGTSGSETQFVFVGPNVPLPPAPAVALAKLTAASTLG